MSLKYVLFNIKSPSKKLRIIIQFNFSGKKNNNESEDDDEELDLSLLSDISSN